MHFSPHILSAVIYLQFIQKLKPEHLNELENIITSLQSYSLPTGWL